jgi:hypothetical protein
MKSIVKPCYRAVVVGFIALTPAMDARAATLIGDVISAVYDYPTLGTDINCSPFSCFTANPFTVTGSASFVPETRSAGPLPDIQIDFSATSLVLVFNRSHIFFDPGSIPFSSATFNGLVFTVVLGSPFDPVASLAGIDLARVSEPNGQLAINLEGLTLPGGSNIIINFAPTGVTPIPAVGLPGMGMVLAGGGLLAWWRRKRKNAPAIEAT